MTSKTPGGGIESGCTLTFGPQSGMGGSLPETYLGSNAASYEDLSGRDAHVEVSGGPAVGASGTIGTGINTDGLIPACIGTTADDQPIRANEVGGGFLSGLDCSASSDRTFVW
ncbi:MULTISPECIES: hypothetical protein [Streptomyces]|nr:MULTISPECIES: hypothetical protein [Streptomyces]